MSFSCFAPSTSTNGGNRKKGEGDQTMLQRQLQAEPVISDHIAGVVNDPKNGGGKMRLFKDHIHKAHDAIRDFDRKFVNPQAGTTRKLCLRIRGSGFVPQEMHPILIRKGITKQDKITNRAAVKTATAILTKTLLEPQPRSPSSKGKGGR